MGTTTWNGIPLRDGYQTSVSGKQVMLNAEVTYSDVPRVIGEMPDDGPVNEEYDAEAPRCDDEELQVSAPVGDSVSVSKKFVNPMNFYAAEKPKQRSKAPL
jgi:DNA repair and recombination protein RAD54B